MVPAVGDVNARKLISHFGSASAVLSEPYGSLIKIQGVGKTIASHICSGKYRDKAAGELDYVRRHDINIKCFDDKDYPPRLKECPDAPLLIYHKGNTNLDEERIISIVGTRNVTRRGKDICKSIIHDLAVDFPDLVIVSGLAYGVDITAHKAALRENLRTAAVLGHGFRTIYPSAHLSIARQMVTGGALLTDFPSFEAPERNNFLKRNRIIAGISDATIIIESGRKGGAMVTADIALSYNREVMAIPGSPGSPASEGCNLLIKSNRAALIESASDIYYNLNWLPGKKGNKQAKLFTGDLSPREDEIFILFREREEMSADQISKVIGKPLHQLSSALLKLEFSGHLERIPGGIYRRKNI